MVTDNIQLYCGRTFTETVRELQPGAANTWVAALHGSQSSGRHSSDFRARTAIEAHSGPSNQPSKGRWRANDFASMAIALPGENPASENNHSGLVKIEYLLSCIQKQTYSARLLHNNITSQNTDEKLFTDLRKVYEEHRGWAWVRLRVLSHIEWKQVSSSIGIISKSQG